MSSQGYNFISAHTLARKGTKTVSIKTRGKEKNRFTAIPAMMANGDKCKMMVIFKGLKKVPKGLKIPNNLVVTVADKGSVNKEIMNQWKREVWAVRQTPVERSRKKTILLFDSYRAHVEKTILSSFKKHYKTVCGVVPGGMTPLLQGIDTHVNRPIKVELKKLYREFMVSGPVELTRGGNKKGPSYQLIVDWCSQVWDNLDKEILIRSFAQTGVTNTGLIEQENLHSKLSAVMDEDGAVADEAADNMDVLDQTGLSDEGETEDEEDNGSSTEEDD